MSAVFRATYADIREALDAVEAAGLPAPRVSLSWHQSSDEVASSVVAAFPTSLWRALEQSGTEWVEASPARGISIDVFLDGTKPMTPALRAQAAIARGLGEVRS
jgi:hypothetical protein